MGYVFTSGATVTQFGEITGITHQVTINSYWPLSKIYKTISIFAVFKFFLFVYNVWTFIIGATSVDEPLYEYLKLYIKS